MTSSRHVTPVDDATFEAEVLRATGPVLVDFGAQWCGPCRALDPIIDRIADEQVGRVKVVTVDIDEAPETAVRYGVRAAPTVMIFEGGEKRAQRVGLTTKEKLLALL
ncbi:MAG: Thioredoxin [Myxococcaceae bacterium]|nr:Thioredoxin [Myxococcaceae bacterium]